MDEIIEYDGKIAVDTGWHNDWNKPEQYRIIYLGKADTDTWRSIIGCRVTWNGNVGTVQSYGRVYRIFTEDEHEWTKLIETRPVKKPRRGKNYDWEWEHGAWQKKW
jgi:hypothetical protein